MSRTLTAMFDSRTDAEAAKARLVASRIDADHIHIHDQGDGGDQGIWASLKSIFVADDDRHTYGEGIRRGGYLLTADVDESEADAAVRILDETGSVDMDRREQELRGSGWSGRFAATDTASTGREEVIPVVEETLRVGKREVERGGARVRSYVREVPVNEQVTLREEHVNVERRPVDRALGANELTGDAFRERSIEMRETSEEAVIAKEARVVEEVVVSKTSDQRTQTVSDTVRKTEVEVDDGPVEKFAGVGGTRYEGERSSDSAGSARTTAGAFDRDATVGSDRDRVNAGIDGTPPLDDGFGTTRR